MSSVDILILGILGGSSLVLAGIGIYKLILQIQILNSVLVSLRDFFDEDFLASLKSFRILAQQSVEMSSRVEALTTTIREFQNFAMAGRSVIPEETPNSGVFAYDEEMAKLRADAMAQEARKEPTPKDDGAVYPAKVEPTEAPSSPF